MRLMTPLLIAGLSFTFASVEAGADGDRSLGLVDVKQPEKRWRVVNDNVMGGRSKGGYDFRDGKLIFAGDTNTNGGGFSSIRATLDKKALAEADGVEIRLKGDTRQYMVGFYQGVRARGLPVVYRADVDHDPEKGWQTVRIPFAKAGPTWLGRPINGAPALDPKRIRKFDLMIYDKKDGKFRLEVDSIAWYTKAEEGSTAGAGTGGDVIARVHAARGGSPEVRKMAAANAAGSE